MTNHKQVTAATDIQARLKRVRTSFSRLGDKWILHYNTLHRDLIRFLLTDARPELRGLFFHWMRGKDICAFLDYEAGAPPFSDDESAAILCHLEMYASFHPSGKGSTARKRTARNRRYAAECTGRVELCRAMLAEEQRNIANAPYDARLLKRFENINRFIRRYDETDDLRKELATEEDPYLRWILESVLGQPVSALPSEGEQPTEQYAGTPLEQLAQQCQAERNLNRLEFRAWACQAMAHKLHYFFIEEFAILLIGVKKYHWDFREEPHPDESMPLSAWREPCRFLSTVLEELCIGIPHEEWLPVLEVFYRNQFEDKRAAHVWLMGQMAGDMSNPHWLGNWGALCFQHPDTLHKHPNRFPQV